MDAIERELALVKVNPCVIGISQSVLMPVFE